MNLNEAEIRARFQYSIHEYCKQHNITIYQLADLIKCSEQTVYQWAAGRVMPREERLRRICDILHWDHDALFSRETDLDRIYDSRYLSFDTINKRYCELATLGSFEKMAVVSYAAVSLYNRLLFSRIPCSLFIDINQENFINIMPDGVYVVGLTIVAGAVLQLGFRDPKTNIVFNRGDFTEAMFSGLVNRLKAINTGTNEPAIDDSFERT